MSASSRPTRAPCAAQASARFTAIVDLPTPPLPEATAMMLRMSGTGLQLALHGVRADVGLQLDRRPLYRFRQPANGTERLAAELGLIASRRETERDLCRDRPVFRP